MEKKYDLTIDLVPYTCTITASEAVIEDLGGTALAKLQLPEREHNSRRYEGLMHDQNWYSVTYNGEDNDLTISSRYAKMSLEIVEELVTRLLAGAEAVGYEYLQNGD